MADPILDKLKADVGIISLTDCTQEENQEFIKLLEQGKSLPSDVVQSEISKKNGNIMFFHKYRQIQSEDEERFILMKICKDLHFIRMSFQILLILAIISVVIYFIVAYYS